MSATTSLKTPSSASSLCTSARPRGPAPGTPCSAADALLSGRSARPIGPSPATPCPPFPLHCSSPLTPSFVASVSSSATIPVSTHFNEMIYKERERTAAVEGEGAYSGKSSQGSSANGKRRASAVSGGRRTTVTTGRVTTRVLRDKNHRERQGEVGA